MPLESRDFEFHPTAAPVEPVWIDLASSDTPPGNRRPQVRSAILSAVIHALVLYLLAVSLARVENPGQAVLLEAGWQAPREELLLAGDLAVAFEATVAADVRGAVTALSEPADSGGMESLIIDDRPLEFVGLPTKTGQGSGPATGDKDGSGSGNGPPGGGPAGAEATYYDQPVQGNVVFIVDGSGSMDGARFNRARSELLYTLKLLGSHQSFFVIFFNNYDFPQFHPRRTREMLPATTENIEKVRVWVGGFRATGDTHPMSALRKALAVEPDAIYFLSDGAFDPRTLDLIRQFNKRKTIIHTIGLEDRAGEPLLQLIAAENGGKYTFVP